MAKVLPFAMGDNLLWPPHRALDLHCRKSCCPSPSPKDTWRSPPPALRCANTSLTLILEIKENERVSCTHRTMAMGRKGNPNASAQQDHAYPIPHHSCQTPIHPSSTATWWSAYRMIPSSTQFPCRSGKDLLSPKRWQRWGQHVVAQHPMYVPILPAGTWAQVKGGWKSLDTPSPPCAREPAHTDFHKNSVEYSPTKGV